MKIIFTAQNYFNEKEGGRTSCVIDKLLNKTE